MERENDMELLKRYLGQYQAAKRRERQLERRLKNICEEMKRPIGGLNYSPVNGRPTNEIGPGAASFVFRKSEQETRIEEQQEVVRKDLLLVMDVLDYLDHNSEEREVLELHYIEGYGFERISRETHMSRSTAFDRQKAGLEKLLTFKRVQKILGEFASRETA